MTPPRAIVEGIGNGIADDLIVDVDMIVDFDVIVDFDFDFDGDGDGDVAYFVPL